MDLCQYKDIFGKPGTGVHSLRAFDLAIVDVLLTFVLAYFVARWFRINLKSAVVLTFMTGALLHWLFCVETTINKLIFS